MSQKKPNILFLFTDQQRFDTISALGNRHIRTPVLDRLVREGTAFTRCYTPSPVCVPARCSLMTGLPPHRTGCVDNMPQPQHIPSFVEGLTTLGYQTHGIGKMHFEPDLQRLWGFESRDVSEELNPGHDDYHDFLREQGFGHVYEPHGIRSEYYYIPQPSQLPAPIHNTAWVADRARNFLQERDRKRPFFLWASFIKPHPPFESPTPWNSLYRCANMPPPFRPEGFEDALTYWNHFQNRYKYRDHGYDELLVRTLRAAYYACISFIDFQVGRILETLGDGADNTLIVLSSDHGELLGDYGSFGKRSMLDPAIRVPMIARWPGHLPKRRRCDTPATLLDIWPTFLSAAGASEPQVCEEGVNLLDLVKKRTHRETVFSQFQQGAKAVYMAASKTGKYIYSAPDQREWFFTLRPDRRETLTNPSCRESRELRAQLLSRFQQDGYQRPLSGNTWRTYRKKSLPANPDAGLLNQDPEILMTHVNALGPYLRR